MNYLYFVIIKHLPKLLKFLCVQLYEKVKETLWNMVNNEETMCKLLFWILV